MSVVAYIEKTFAIPSFWWFFVLVVSISGAIALWKWRRRWRGILATVLLGVAMANLILWPLCWGRSLSFSFVSYSPHGAERWRSWRILMAVKYGAVHLEMEEYQFWKGIIPPASPTLQVASSNFVGPSRSNHLYSLTRASFLEKALGFQILWGGERVDPEREQSTTLTLIGLTVPQWFILLICPPYPAFWIRGMVRGWHRSRNHRCVSCGYLLIAHKPGERCPECSTVIHTTYKGPEVAVTPGAEGQGGESKG
jgi:hypothetical protein